MRRMAVRITGVCSHFHTREASADKQMGSSPSADRACGSKAVIQHVDQWKILAIVPAVVGSVHIDEPKPASPAIAGDEAAQATDDPDTRFMPTMLERIPASYFESMGLACGFLACGTIAAQVLSEYANPGPSSLSPIYSLGFLLIFVFWTVYGLRFHRLALWLTNGLAVILQGLLICLTLG